MTDTVRPRRSVIYMPGSNARALEKGRSLDVDGLILDLEDAVSPDAKELARSQIVSAIDHGGYGHRELVVRVNGLQTPWGKDDIVAASKTKAHAILLPKVESPNEIKQASDLMAKSGAPDGMAIWCMMETPRGMLRAERIAAAGNRLQAFAMGTADLAKDLHCAHTRDRLPMITSLGLCMLAARAEGLAILDGVHLNLDDSEGFEYSCRQGLELGFDGKTLIHPKQIDTANKVFSPSDAEIAWSEKIIAAHAEAEAQKKGVVVVDGRLVEHLHVKNAKRILALAQAIASRGGATPS